MDITSDLATLRAKLQAMRRRDALELAKEAGVPGSTVEKIRLGHISDPSFTKVLALCNALAARDAVLRKPARIKPVATKAEEAKAGA